MPPVFTDPSVARYHSPGHPEAPFRVARTAERLRASGFDVRPPGLAAAEKDALLAHSPAHLERLRLGTYEDPDTPHYPDIQAAAMTSLSGSLSAARSALEGSPAFSLMRPPGHHAGRDRIAGFCYLNNLAVACLKALAEKKAGRIAVLDIDVHHGDGTQELLLGRPEVRFLSLHQSPLYPGTGQSSEGNCFNIPLPAGTTEDTYLRHLEDSLEVLVDFNPDLLAVSAGFDTYKDCPLAGMRLEKQTYRRIGALAAGTGLRRFAVLEGGYADDLPELVELFLKGFFS